MTGAGPLRLEVVTARTMSPAVRDQLLALCSDAYEEDFSPELNRLAAATHVLGWLDGQLVSHAAWVERELRAATLAQPLRTAYVEAVATATALQGRGYGRQVMGALPPLLVSFDLAALSPSEVPFYAALGWELWQGPLQYRHGDEVIQTPDEQVMILRLPGTPAALDLRSRLGTDWRDGDVW